MKVTPKIIDGWTLPAPPNPLVDIETAWVCVAVSVLDVVVDGPPEGTVSVPPPLNETPVLAAYVCAWVADSVPVVAVCVCADSA